MCQSRVLCTWHMSYEKTILSSQSLPLKSFIERVAIEEMSTLTRRGVYGPSIRSDHRSFSRFYGFRSTRFTSSFDNGGLYTLSPGANSIAVECPK